MTEIAMDAHSVLRRGLRRLDDVGAFLRAADPSRIDRALAAAAAMLADPHSPLGRQAREALPARARLSPEMIDWALTTTLETVSLQALAECREALARAIHPHRVVPARLHAVVLSSNLCTASIKPIVWSLLLGAPVALKLASGDEGLAELFALALILADDEVGQAILPTRFSRDDEAMTRTLIAGADAVSIFGSDLSVQSLLPMISAGSEWMAHGHGLGAAFVGRASVDADLDALAADLALDVAAYDQRGCLSPQMIFVEEGGVQARQLAQALSGQLTLLATRLPRAALQVPQATQQVQWRRVSESLGELFEGDGHSVALDDYGPVRACPLARNIAVHVVRDPSELAARLGHFGIHLKCLAVTGLAPRLEAPLCPRVTRPGWMQRPTLLDLHDGRTPWHGLMRLTSR